MSTTKHIPAVIASCLCRGHTSFAKQAAHLTNYASVLSPSIRTRCPMKYSFICRDI
jgi:hypothetical protein